MKRRSAKGVLNLECPQPTLDDVRAFWDKNPCLADQGLEERNCQFEPELSFITKNFPFKSALDVGCGTGFEPINYKLKGCKRVVGLDASRGSLEVAKDRGDYGVQWTHGNAEALPFRNDAFEFASAIGSLHHTPNTVKAIAELERVASKEVVIMLYGYEWMIRWRVEHSNAQANYDDGCPIVKFYAKEQLSGLFHRTRVAEIQPFKNGWAWYIRAAKKN